MRTGSTWLCSLLNKHDQIDCQLELLHRRTYTGTVCNAKSYINNCYSTSDKPLRGFKVLYHQFRGPQTPSCQILVFLFKHIYKCKIIHIKRRDFLQLYVSHKLANASGLWNAFISDKKLNFKTKLGVEFEDLDQCLSRYNKKFTIDMDDIHKHYNKLQFWYDYIDHQFPDNLEVFYEDLPNVDNICRYLGVPMPISSLESETVKLRRLPIQELVNNYDEVIDYLAKAANPSNDFLDRSSI